MRTTVTIDDALHDTALALADPAMDQADRFREPSTPSVSVNHPDCVAVDASTEAQRWGSQR